MTPIPLSKLKFGHEALHSMNARKAAREEGVDSLAASIEAHGLIYPLVVRQEGDTAYVIDGNRRLAALRLLLQQGRRAPEVVPCEVQDLRANADEISLAANVMRLPLHEADQYEAFFRLKADEKLSDEDIAGRFGLPVKRVAQLTALGRLAPKILDAWREGELGRDAREVAQAFTLAPSLAEQEKLFARLKKSPNHWDGLNPGNVRRAFGADEREAARHVAFVGLEAYRKAGGVAIEDLFGGNHVITNGALAKRLADTKLEKERGRLQEQGWSWVALSSEIKESWQYGRLQPSKGKPTADEAARLEELRKICRDADQADERTDEEVEVWQAASEEIDAIEAAIQARGFGPKQKAKAGCIIGIGHDGSLAIDAGRVKPEAVKKAKAEKTKKARAMLDAGDDAEAGPKISNAVAHDLSVQLTLGLQKALPATPRVALAALLAGAGSRYYTEGPMRVRLEGLGVSRNVGDPRYDPDADEEEDEASFAGIFANLLGLSVEDLLAAAAAVAAKALSLESHTADGPGELDENNTALVAALDPAAVNVELRRAWQAEDYFNRVPKPLCLAAIEEAVGADAAKAVKNKPKKEIVKAASEQVPPTGWLPPQLRTQHYDGPGDVPKKPEPLGG